ncbi:hypothetical protein [Nocardia tengchongensis]
MADLLAEVSHHTLSKADQQRLRRPWESLLQPETVEGLGRE